MLHVKLLLNHNKSLRVKQVMQLATLSWKGGLETFFVPQSFSNTNSAFALFFHSLMSLTDYTLIPDQSTYHHWVV